MQISATNCGSREVTPLVFCQLHSGTNPSSLETGRQRFEIFEAKGSKPLLSFEAYIGMELSLVPQVESVFVEWDKENGRAYHVITVINERDPNVRARVYEREQAVMDAFPNVDFNFRVISRMNRSLVDVVDQAGKLAYQR